MFLHNEIDVCVDCRVWVIQGYVDDPDPRWEEPTIPEGCSAHPGDRTDEYSRAECDLCGSTLGGERHRVTLLCDHDSCTPGDKLSLSEALPDDCWRDCSAQGDVTEAVAYWNKRLDRYFARITPEMIRADLNEYGAWDDGELADDTKNRERYLWIAACDRKESEAEREREA